MPAVQTQDERRADAATVLAVAREALADAELTPFDIARSASDAVTAALSFHSLRTDRWRGDGAWYEVTVTGRRAGVEPRIWVHVYGVDQYGNFVDEPRGWTHTSAQAVAFADRVIAWRDRLSVRPTLDELLEIAGEIGHPS